MEMLASVLAGKPENVLIVSIAFFVAYLVPRFAAPANRRRFSSLLIASVAWGVYAAWEWLVQAKTPEANIRFDLLVIWPILTILSA
jgi:putative copper export protein